MKTSPISRILCMLVVLALLFLCACPGTAPSYNGPPIVGTLAASAAYAAENVGVTLTATAEGVTGTWEFTAPAGVSCTRVSENSARITATQGGVYTVTAKNGNATATCTVSLYDSAGTYTADNSLIKYVGRTEASGTARIINIGTSGFEVAFYGTALKMNMLSANAPHIPVGDGDGACRYSVFVDGETDPGAQELVVKTATNGDYTIVSFDEPGYHRVKIQRQSEARYADNTLVNLQVEGGGLLPVPASTALRIEAFGDSITAGVGALRAPGVADGIVFGNDSGLHTYAGLAAAALGAEFSAMAVSGAGLCDTPMDNHNPDHFLKNFYNRVAFAKADVFPASDYVPDAVVINIGTNDLNKDAHYDKDEYKATYIQLVKDLPARYAGHDVTFFLCSGLMDTVLAPVIAEIVETLQSEGVYAVAVKFDKAANGHPNRVEHEAAAEKLAQAIRNVFGIAE